ncbi:DUF2442 domain-containing protein [Deefgea sp. CFH1-16]|uniref:DUF2442 domain-containing protein n=1 Tax=Deefgea sp. CFH1-16 TaxID=2675457 RepID=UPI0015F72056|nr:DUF2442 domain-containing protein [Deefgea sp. CFH1-16]MBM5573682.1 DUF2442 domain-containing protein [Deefgea sp. CFH1-16]
MLHIKQARYLRDYTLAVEFDDGRRGEADLSAALNQGLFQALRDTALFAQVSVEPELNTIVWPNGLDLAPEYVYFAAFKNDPDLQSQFKRWGYLN